ncbi:nodulation protein NfeD [Dyella solisilvae]|uniref:Nodulation protein NfeD n=1 Tax=Dyella solisilvae TaxID=1920168 RepID=A0A370KB36_9GAMM|nr:nodulation protein NfeD [Dyella solisilvae]RDI99872.1 nodulation protein NfeD [Dyella solisilvae]
MRRWLGMLAGALVVVLLAGSTVAAPATGGPTRAEPFVARLDLIGPIGPASAEYVDDVLQRATQDGASAIIVQLDTPGGLSDSMRQIIASLLAAKLPVLGYVAPSGARAASAGTYILYACPFSAMAPATHLGAATPVPLGGESPLPVGNPPAPAATAAKPPPDAESTKVLNDAIASIRSLAQLNNHNAAWAEQAVRGAATLTANEALQNHVIDLIAPDTTALLAGAEGHHVRVAGADVTLHLAGLPVRDYPPNWRTRFLGIITHPTLAYLLLLAGVYGLVLEAFHPGALLPGVAGAICLLIGLYALQLLPVNYAGLALMALGIGLVLAEALAPSVGAIGIGGVIAFVIGSVMLFNTGVPGYAVNVGVIGGIGLSGAAVLAMLLRLVTRSRRARPFNGDAQLLLATGELMQAVSAGGEGWARIAGEQWRVHSEAALPAGARVRVTGRDGLLLRVTQA